MKIRERRKRAIIRDIYANLAIAFQHNGTWHCILYPYRYLKDYITVKGHAPVNAIITGGFKEACQEVRRCRKARRLGNCHISARLKSKISMEVYHRHGSSE
jgi:hypothetical protein